MLPLSATAVVARNEVWTNHSATEPYECGWAKEAIVFLRALKMPIGIQGCDARIQISPDGMKWLDSGKKFKLPEGIDEIGWETVQNFGNWLRVAVDLPEGASICVLVSFHLKA